MINEIGVKEGKFLENWYMLSFWNVNYLVEIVNFGRKCGMENFGLREYWEIVFLFNWKFGD